MAQAIYDRIGNEYAAARRSDPRIAASIQKALGAAATVVNVGAGTGSYEPEGRRIVAVEPSRVMIRQRAKWAAPAVQAMAEALPFAARSFDCAMAVLTIHHWLDPMAGLREMRRVARQRVLVLTWDQDVCRRFWLFDYLPGLREFDARRAVPIEAIANQLGETEIVKVPIPRDCTDSFLGAFWSRPEAYLDPGVRAKISCFAQADEAEYRAGLQHLASDLKSGNWQAKYGGGAEGWADLGYRLMVAENKG